jgi:hypothetical protein
LLFSDSGAATKGIYGTVGLNDAWRLMGGATASDSGWLEIATGDDAIEPIYVRQYRFIGGTNMPYSHFGQIIHSATLLDESGNTSFPGTVTASAFLGNASSATKLATARSITLSGNTKGTATFDGSANVTITTSTDYAMSASLDASGNDIVSTYATKTELSNATSSTIQPFDLLDSNEVGTFWTQTNTNSIAVPFMTDSKVVTHKVRIYINSTAGAKIRCAVYKNRIENEEYHLDLVGQTQIFQEERVDFIDIPFETVTTLESDTLYYFAFECSSSDATFLGKQIKANLTWILVYKGDALNVDDTFKSEYPTNGNIGGNVFIPYFKII